MSKKLVTSLCICAGLALLVASALWPYLVPVENYWTEEQQAEFTEGLRHAHELESRSGAKSRNSKDSKEAKRLELEAAQAYRQQQLDKLAQAKVSSRQPGQICFWAGLALCAVGLLAYRFVGGDSAEDS